LHTGSACRATGDHVRGDDTSKEAIAGKRGRFPGISRFESKRPTSYAQRPTFNSEGN
jgi:hypothetical protein